MVAGRRPACRAAAGTLEILSRSRPVFSCKWISEWPGAGTRCFITVQRTPCTLQRQVAGPERPLFCDSNMHLVHTLSMATTPRPANVLPSVAGEEFSEWLEGFEARLDPAGQAMYDAFAAGYDLAIAVI